MMLSEKKKLFKQTIGDKLFQDLIGENSTKFCVHFNDCFKETELCGLGPQQFFDILAINHRFMSEGCHNSSILSIYLILRSRSNLYDHLITNRKKVLLLKVATNN